MTLHRVAHRLIVDDIVSEFGHDEQADASVHRAPMFKIKNDHEGELCTNEVLSPCKGCDCLHPCCFSGHMRWDKNTPIIRFTSEGLQVT